jgi:hypothetical protein
VLHSDSDKAGLPPILTYKSQWLQESKSTANTYNIVAEALVKVLHGSDLITSVSTPLRA